MHIWKYPTLYFNDKCEYSRCLGPYIIARYKMWSRIKFTSQAHTDIFVPIEILPYMSHPFMPTVAFNICCPRDCVSRHNGGTAGGPLKPLRDDSALRGLRIKKYRRSDQLPWFLASIYRFLNLWHPGLSWKVLSNRSPRLELHELYFSEFPALANFSVYTHSAVYNHRET